MTITHVDATQITDPIEDQLRTCFELKELESKRGMYYNLPNDDILGTKGAGNKIFKIGDNYFYFMTLGGNVKWLVSTRQFNFTTEIQYDLDNGKYPAEFIEMPQEVEVMKYIQGVDRELEEKYQKKMGARQNQLSKYRYFEDGNGNLYVECRLNLWNPDTNEFIYEIDTSYIYPAEQFVFKGISLTKFKEEGTPIFDMRQGIDTVSEVA